MLNLWGESQAHMHPFKQSRKKIEQEWFILGWIIVLDYQSKRIRNEHLNISAPYFGKSNNVTKRIVFSRKTRENGCSTLILALCIFHSIMIFP
jgi:hypothetical protein